MAHQPSSIPRLSLHDREHISLNNLPSAYGQPDSPISKAPDDPQDVDPSAEVLINNHEYSRTKRGRTAHNQHDSFPISNEPEMAAQYLSSTPMQKPHCTKHLSNPLSKPTKFSVCDWQWEFAAAMFSLSTLVALFSVLVSYDSKSLSSLNLVFGITLNTLIAILSTLSRTALMVPVASCMSQLKWIHLVGAPVSLRNVQIFEDASRGPWGSLELIWRLHIRMKLATWGSIITILTLALGPFSQQLLSYPSRAVLLDGALFYRAQIYDSQYGTQRNARGALDLPSTMGPQMQGAILNGLFNLSSPQQFDCPTGNCQWDEFPTLAVTSACQNVTADTKAECTNPGPEVSCEYSTPAGFVIRAIRWSSLAQGTGYTYFNATAFKPDMFNSVSGLWNQDHPTINSTILRFSMANMQGNFDMERPEVLECDMRWCARVTRNLTTTNGTFHPGVFEDIELTGVVGDHDRNDDSRQWYTFNVSEDLNPSFQGNRSFSVQAIDHDGIQRFLYDIFTADNSGPFFLPLLNSTNRSETVASISRSMSYALGQAPSGTQLEGQTISSELYVQVHWPWITLSLVEVTMGIAFLVCTLIHTQRKGVNVWKCSGIVPLLIVMVGWDKNELRAASWKEITRQSKHMRGQLVPSARDVQGFYRE